MSARLHRGPRRSREGAECVLTELRALSGLVSAQVEGGHCASERERYKRHSVFLDLYRLGTQRWIEHAGRARYPEFVYQVIIHLFSHHRRYVVEPMLSGQQRYPQHWSAYFSNVDDVRRRYEPYRHAVLLYLGIRAHVRFDLAEAIVDAYRFLSRSQRSAPDLVNAKRDLVDADTNEVLTYAARRFVEASGSAGLNMNPRLFVKLVQRRARYVEALWLPCVQRWRKQAWQEAMESLRAGRRPDRPCADNAPRNGRRVAHRAEGLL